MKKKSILQVCLSPSWGGLEMSAIKMTQLYSDLGFGSYCLCKDNSPLFHELKKLNLNAIPVTGRNYFSISIMFRLRRCIKEYHISEIHSHFLKDLWIIKPALWGYPHIKLIGFARMFLNNVKKKDALHRIVYNRLNKLVALSTLHKNNLLKALPVPSSKYAVIPDGIDTDRYKPRGKNWPLRNEFGAPTENHVLIGFVGRLDRQKGILELIESIALIHKNNPLIRLVIVGEETKGESPFTNLIKKQIHKYRLENIIFMAGFRDDIPSVLSAFDIFVMPSYEETFGLVLIEALASGLPCVSTNAGGVPDILKDKINGFLVPPKQVGPLSNCLEKLAQDKPLRETISLVARKSAQEKFDIKSVILEIQKL